MNCTDVAYVYCLCMYVYLKAYIDRSCRQGPALPETTDEAMRRPWKIMKLSQQFQFLPAEGSITLQTV